MKKIILLSLMLVGFFAFGAGEAYAAGEGACVCNKVDVKFKPKLFNEVAFSIDSFFAEGMAEDKCKDGVLSTSNFAYSATSTYQGCNFLKDTCLCTASTTQAFVNGKKIAFPGVAKENCATHTSSTTLPIVNIPVDWSNCTWFEVKAPTKSDPTPSVVGGSSSGGAVGGGSSAGTATQEKKKISAEDASAAGQQAAGQVTKIKLQNPLGGETDIRKILGNIITAGLGILGSVTLLVFVFGGFMWLTSAGSAEKVKKGTQTMLWAVVGLFLIFGSYGIMGLVLESIGAKEQGNDISSKLGTSDPTAPSPTTENPVVGGVCGDGTIGPGELCDDAGVPGGCSDDCLSQ